VRVEEEEDFFGAAAGVAAETPGILNFALLF